MKNPEVSAAKAPRKAPKLTEYLEPKKAPAKAPRASKAPAKALDLELNLQAELQAATEALKPALERLGRIVPTDPSQLPPGALADLLYDLNSVSSQLAHLADAFTDIVEPAIKNIEDYFINSLQAGESSGIQGMRSRVQISAAHTPTVQDWLKLYEHIKKTGNFELLQKRLSNPAVKERWENKKQVPGVHYIITKKVSCTKLNGKGI